MSTFELLVLLSRERERRLLTITKIKGRKWNKGRKERKKKWKESHGGNVRQLIKFRDEWNTVYSLSPCAFCMCFVIFIFLPSSFKSPRYTFFYGVFFVFAFKSRESTKTCYLLAFLAYSFIFFASSVLCPCLKPNESPRYLHVALKWWQQ